MSGSDPQIWKLPRHGLIILLELAVTFVVLNACLVVLDTPAIEAFPADHVKKLRYTGRDHVFRDEDYSRYHINSKGLVSPERPPSNSAYRIAVFGDSFVESFQVPYEFKFTTLLEKQFRPSAKQINVEVWNFGFAGDNTGNAYARWLHQAKNTHFDLVIFSFNDRDLLENRPQDVKGPSGAFLVPQDDQDFRLDYSRIHGDIRPFDKWMKSVFGKFFHATHSLHLRIKEKLTSTVSNWRSGISQMLGREASAAGSKLTASREEVTPDMIDNTRRQLLFVQKQISSEGIPVVLLGLPTAEIMPGSKVENAQQRRLAYTAVAHALSHSNIHFVDAYPVLANAMLHGKDPYADWEPGGHLNRNGHQMVAQSLFLALQQTSWQIAPPSRNSNAVQ